MIALGSSLVALAALVLTAYLARLNLQHQRLEAHRGRVWERQVDIVPEFLEWLKTDAAAADLRSTPATPSIMPLACQWPCTHA